MKKARSGKRQAAWADFYRELVHTLPSEPAVPVGFLQLSLLGLHFRLVATPLYLFDGGDSRPLIIDSHHSQYQFAVLGARRRRTEQEP